MQTRIDIVVPQVDDLMLFSFEDDFGDLDEIPTMISDDQFISTGRGTSTMQTQTSKVCTSCATVCVCVCVCVCTCVRMLA